MAAERTCFWIKILGQFFFVQFVAAISNCVSPAAIETFQFPRVDREVFRLKMVILADQRAFVPRTVLGAFSARWSFGFHGISV